VNQSQRIRRGLPGLTDICAVILACALTTLFIAKGERGISIIQFLAMRTKISNLVLFLLILLVCHAALSFCGLYGSRKHSKRRAEVVDIFKATAVTVACFVALSSVFSIRMVTVAFLAVFWVMMPVILSMIRVAARRFAAQFLTHDVNLRHLLILGTNPRAMEFARKITADKRRGYRLLGFVDDDWPGIGALKATGFPIVSDSAGLAEYLRRNVVDEVAIYLPFGSLYKTSLEVANLCRVHGIVMRFSADVFGMNDANMRAEELDGESYLTTYTESAAMWPSLFKRVVDMAGGLITLLLVTPVLIAAALAIKMTSKGPVLFRQERVGFNKRHFTILKFRTMVAEAESLMPGLEQCNEVSGPVFKMKRDPRITPIGRILRKTSIDELPQLFNVLNGTMSLVGPRPLPIRDFERFNEDWQRRRFSVKPGMTCLWQVDGRSSISFDKWMLLDLKYMDEWSLWLDFKILARTVPAVFKGLGAA